MLNQEDVLTLKDACEFLALKKSRLYHLVYLGKIPHYKVGTSLRFSRIKLRQWLATQERGNSNDSK